MPAKEKLSKSPSVCRDSIFRISVLLMAMAVNQLTYAQSIAEQEPVSDPVVDYMNAIDNIEAELSAYSIELSDLYLGLGKSLYSREEYENARRAFQRGMQIERVNYGLDSLTQAPYLISIADTESYLGNWDESQKALENLYTINTKAYGANDVRMLPILDQLLDWYMGTYKERTPKGGYSSLVISERIAARMYDILNTDMPLDDPDAPDRYRRLGYLQYFIANHIKQHGEPSDSGLSISMAGSSGRPSSATTSHMHFRRGKLALEKVIEALVEQPDSTEIDQAMAIAELGDWYLVFGQKFSATQAYQLAFDVLETTENPEQARTELFSAPRLIEFSMDKSPEAVLSDKSSESQLELSMMISTYGVANQIEVTSSPQSLTENQLSKLRRDMRSKRFRPRLVNGLAAEAPHSMLYDQPTPKG
jgi:tetratricopeptide (TPR) repeat protein